MFDMTLFRLDPVKIIEDMSNSCSQIDETLKKIFSCETTSPNGYLVGTHSD